MAFELISASLKDAKIYINENHRHHRAPQGHKFSIFAYKNGNIAGLVMCGRPVARHLDDGKTIEVIRLCTNGEKNCCSFLYAAEGPRLKISWL